ncbi:hypothetical protein F5B20DRAFT_574428 [Whalleya microplaca]|nr:hypothetical protein F5B20DRAFT_574428 [Whalleya microplaca]
MDPVTALSVAAAATQFGAVALKVIKRISAFVVLQDIPNDAEGPKSFVENLRSQLVLLNNTIRRIEEGLSSCKEDFQDDELRGLNDCILNLNRQGKKLDKILDKYLPNDADSTPAKLWAAIRSIAADKQIDSVLSNIKDPLSLLTSFLLTSLVFKDGAILDSLGSTGVSAGHSQKHLSVYHVSRYEVRYYVDRPEILAQVNCLLEENTQSPKIAILQGMGGQGKTQLALRYCREARSRRRYDCIFWVDASTRASTIRGLEKISEEFGDNAQDSLGSDALIALVKRKLTADNLSWLLVFDNYDDPSLFDLRDYIPQGTSGNVLVTSRSLGLKRIGPKVCVSGMTENEATELLLKQIDATEIETDQSAAADIVRRLGYLPLAIDQAGAYIKAEGILITDFLSHYEQSSREILESVPSLWEYTETAPSNDGQKTEVAKTVFTTWNLSFTLLKPDTPMGALKASVLSLLACFDEHEISEEEFKNFHSSETLDQSPKWLSLKETDHAFVSLHPLVRDWINLRQENDAHREYYMMFTRILAASLSGTFWEGHHKPKLRPIIIDIEREGLKVATAAEGLIAAALRASDEYKSSYEVCRWLWDACGVNDNQMRQVKFDAGIEKAYCLMQLRRMKRARDESREMLKYWTAVQEPSISTDNMLYRCTVCLIQSLSFTMNDDDDREIIDICRDGLERLPCSEQNMPKRHCLLGYIVYASNSFHRGHVASSTRQTMLDETAQRGGNSYRRKIWSRKTWFNVVSSLIDDLNNIDLLDQLSLAAFEWAIDSYGANKEWALSFRGLRARALGSMGRFAEAEAIARDSVEMLTDINSNHSNLSYAIAYQELGYLFEYKKRYEDAYEAYNSALLRAQSTGLEDLEADLLLRCGIVAHYFNPRLAEVHLDLSLSRMLDTALDSEIIDTVIVLFYSKEIGTSEEAFQLSKTVFEMASIEEEDITKAFIGWVFAYVQRWYTIDADAQRVQDSIEWAEIQACDKLEGGIEGNKTWWESTTTELWKRTEASKGDVDVPEVGTRKGSRIIQRLRNTFSSATTSKPHRSSLSLRLGWSLKDGLRLGHSVAVSPARPATTELEDCD